MVEKPFFYRNFNAALVNSNPVEVSRLVLDALLVFGWSPEDKARLLEELHGGLSAPGAVGAPAP